MELMRRWNSWIGKCLIFLLFLHGLAAGYMLAELQYLSWVKPVGYAACAVLAVHTVFAVLLSVDAWRAGRSGRWYMRENTVFWLRRLTGLAMLFFLFFHFGAYGSMVSGRYVLRAFTPLLYAAQLGLLIAAVLHVAVSMKGMLVADGVTRFQMWRNLSFLVLAVFLLLTSIAVTIYYLAWNG